MSKRKTAICSHTLTIALLCGCRRNASPKGDHSNKPLATHQNNLVIRSIERNDSLKKIQEQMAAYKENHQAFIQDYKQSKVSGEFNQEAIEEKYTKAKVASEAVLEACDQACENENCPKGKSCTEECLTIHKISKNVRRSSQGDGGLQERFDLIQKVGDSKLNEQAKSDLDALDTKAAEANKAKVKELTQEFQKLEAMLAQKNNATISQSDPSTLSIAKNHANNPLGKKNPSKEIKTKEIDHTVRRLSASLQSSFLEDTTERQTLLSNLNRLVQKTKSSEGRQSAERKPELGAKGQFEQCLNGIKDWNGLISEVLKFFKKKDGQREIGQFIMEHLFVLAKQIYTPLEFPDAFHKARDEAKQANTLLALMSIMDPQKLDLHTDCGYQFASLFVLAGVLKFKEEKAKRIVKGIDQKLGAFEPKMNEEQVKFMKRICKLFPKIGSPERKYIGCYIGLCRDAAAHSRISLPNYIPGVLDMFRSCIGHEDPEICYHPRTKKIHLFRIHHGTDVNDKDRKKKEQLRLIPLIPYRIAGQ